MTPQKKLAMAERREYDGLSAEERRAYDDIGDFVHKHYPEVTERSAMLRSRLFLAGSRADAFWKRVEDGMPLSTAVRLLGECEKEWRQVGADAPDIDEFIRRRLARYDSEGTVRRVGDRVFRASTSSGRASRIAQGAEAPREKKDRFQGRLKTAVREAIAAWVASRLPRGDRQVSVLAGECMREVEVVLDSFTARITQAQPRRADLFAACDRLNIPRPRWGQRADQERAWKNRRSALRSLHPDTLGHEGGREAFQGIKDSYDIIVAYNDSLPGKASAPAETNTDKGSGDNDGPEK